MEQMKHEVIPYLSFHGECERALGAYIHIFGGGIDYLSRWPADAPPEQAGKVMHAEFHLGATRMAAGDAPGHTGGNTDIKLMLHMGSQQQAQEASALLSEGGRVLSPLQPHPAPDDGGCGCLIEDRFGYLWILTCPNPAKAGTDGAKGGKE